MSGTHEATILEDLAEVMDLLTPQERQYIDQLLDMPPEKSAAAMKIERDSFIWRRSIFPAYFSKEDGWFHEKFWKKVWALQRDVAPPPLLLPWARDLGKSVLVRTAGIAAAARGLRRYILYLSGVQEQSDKHVMTISRMLRSSGIAMYYPDLGTAQLNDATGAQVSWNRKRIVTASGLVIDSLGLDSASRGINYEELRPDWICVDDIDKATDSPIEVRKKIELLAGSIFPTGQDNTWIIFAQNVIHDNSVMARTLDDRAEILHDADIIGPVPALRSYSFSKTMGKGGRPKFKILKGETTWSGFSLLRAEKELNASGYEFFEREYQHNTKLIKPGAIYPGYSALHHVVTWEELAIGFADNGLNIRGRGGDDEYIVPYYWHKGVGLDFGTTIEHPSVVRWVTVSGEYDPFNDIWIFYRERCLPKYPHQKGEPVEAVSPIVLSKVIREAERPWREADNMITRVMSHEQTAAQRTFNQDEALFAKQAYDFGDENKNVDFTAFDGMDFKKRIGDARSGIAQMQDRLFLDMERDHPFRRYPDGYVVTHEDGTEEDMSGKAVKGRPYVLFVVDNDQGALYVDHEGKLNVQSARDDGGMIRSRSERQHYCNAASQDGRQQNKPVQFFNDAMDAERYIAEDFAVEAAPATRDQRIERAVAERNPNLEMGKILSGPPSINRQTLLATRQRLIDEVEKSIDDGESHSYGNALLDRLEKMKDQR